MTDTKSSRNIRLVALDRIVFLPLDVATVPPAGRIFHYTNYWWATDPARGLLFYRQFPKGPLYPQCNANESIARQVAASFYPDAVIMQIPSVFVSIDSEGEVQLPASVTAATADETSQVEN